MSSDDQRAKDLVIKTLEDPNIKDIKFGIGLYEIDGASFGAVLGAVRSGKITVKYDANGGYAAQYNQARNELTLSFTYAPSYNHNALIVHECVHAAMDAQHQKFKLIDHMTSEAAGYIAQCMFKITKMAPFEFSNRLRSSRHAVTDKIFRSAWNIALAYHTGGRISSNDLIDLETALKTHPMYARKSNKIANFGGVHQIAARAQNAGRGHAHAH
jgi:hypothetical protein